MSAAMLQPRPRSLRFVIFLTAWSGCLTATLAFKTADFPIQLINSTNSTVARQANEAIARNLASDMKQMNTVPDPAVNQTENETGEANETAEGPEGMAGLGRTLEFMMLKITQLETLAEVQQAEIESLRKNFKEHLNADHTDSKVALVQKDPHAHLEEVQATMRGVIKKHAHQLKHREFHPRHHASQAELLEKRKKTTKANAADASLDSTVSSKVVGWVEDRFEDVKDGTGLVGDALGDAYAGATDQIDFVARTTIDTVGKAMDILTRGFTDWSASCPTANMPWISIDNNGLGVYFGHVHCRLSLMGQKVDLFNFNFGHRHVWLPHNLRVVTGGGILDLMPSPVRLVATSHYEAVRTVFSVGFELMHCHHRGHHHDLIRCLAHWVYHLVNPLPWLPDPVKLVAGSAYEAVRTVFSVGWELAHCPHRGHHHQLIGCLGGWIQHLAPAVHWMAAPLKLVAGSAYEAVRTVFSVGWELMHCPHRGHHHQLIQCLGGWIQHFAPPLHWMPNPVKTLANGNIMGLLPGQLNQIASGDIMGLLPGQLNQIASGDIMGLLPGQLNQIASGNIMGLLPGQLNQIASGNIMGLMPGPMQLLGGGQTNSIQNMLTLGDALMKCSDSQQQDLVQCLGFQIVGSVPPLNFLNRLGDIFGEFIAAFAKVASTVAAQAMKGGESLLQTAATTEFPSAGAQAMVHHRGPNLVITKHSQQLPTRQQALLQEMANLEACSVALSLLKS